MTAPESTSAQADSGVQPGAPVHAGPWAVRPFWPLLVFYGFSAFAFGCMEDWSVACCEVILVIGALFALQGTERSGLMRSRLSVPFLCAGLLAVMACVQLTPLPTSLWRSFGAERAAVYDQGREAEEYLRSPLYRQDPFAPPRALPASDAAPFKTPPAPAWLPGSFTPIETARALLAIVAFACLLLLLAQGVTEGGGSGSRLGLAVGLIGLAVALTALATGGGESGKIMGIRPSAFAKDSFGPFVDANHGAAFVGLSVGLLYFSLWRAVRRQHLWRDKAGLVLGIASVAAIHLAAVAASRSWSNVAILALYLPVFLFRPLRRRPGLQKAAFFGALALAAGIVLLGLHIGVITLHGRWDQVKNLSQKHFLIGNGLGSFEQRWPAAMSAGPLDVARHEYLESEAVQLLFEGGLGGGLVGCAGLAWVLVLCARALSDTSSAFVLIPSFLGEAVRSFTDFSFHVFPVLGAFVLVAALVGAHTSRSESRPGKGGKDGPAPLKPRPGGRASKPLLASVLILVAVCAITLHWQPLTLGTQERAPYRQGIFRPVVRAEDALRAGRPGEALRQFVHAAQSAKAACYEGTFQSIRWRMGAAGRDLVRSDWSSGWPFLQRYALWSGRFKATSRQVEEWALEEGLAPRPVFEYELYSRETGRTAWGNIPAVYLLPLLRRLPEETSLRALETQLYGETPETLPPQRYAVVIPFWIYLGRVPAGCEVEIAGGGPYRGVFYPSLNYRVQWDAPFRFESSRAVQQMDSNPYRVVDRVVDATSEWSERPVAIRLIHRYKPL